MVESAVPSAIAVRVRLFASYREAAGTGREEMAVPAGSRVSDLVQVLRNRFPRFAPNGGLVAVNHEYVGETYTLHDGDEVAFIPPVSGGADHDGAPFGKENQTPHPNPFPRGEGVRATRCSAS